MIALAMARPMAKTGRGFCLCCREFVMRFTKILKRFAILATRLFFAGLSLELSTVSYSAEAATAVPTELSPEERRTVSQAERYLNDIKTLQARFIQESSNGGVAQGRIYLSRPGKLRFEYDPPTPILIVSSGLVVTYYDRELEQVSEVLLSATPLDVLVRDNVELVGDVTLTRMDRRGGIVRLTLRETDEPDKGSMTLVFTEKPFELRQWVVVDSQGISTKITLDNIRLGIPLNDELFRFVAPKSLDSRD